MQLYCLLRGRRVGGGFPYAGLSTWRTDHSINVGDRSDLWMSGICVFRLVVETRARDARMPGRRQRIRADRASRTNGRSDGTALLPTRCPLGQIDLS